MRPSRSVALTVLVVSLLTLPAAARAESYLLPGVARANGLGGTRFVSVVWLHNPGDASLAVDLALVSAGGASSSRSLTLAARETRRIEDPVLSLFGLDSAAGTLTASASGPLVLRGVTANVADPRGTYGLGLAGLRAEDSLRAGETGIASWLSHTAVAGTGFRTNVAVTLLEPGSEAWVAILDDIGLVRGEARVAGAAPLFWQRSVGDLSADPEIPLGRVEVRVVSGSAVAYAAVVDNVTGDGILAPAIRPGGPGDAPAPLLVPGTARTPGANGTLWRTGLRLVNTARAPVAATLEGVGLSGAERVAVSVPPGGILEEADLLGALGLAEGSAGAVRVTASSPLAALAVTRNVDPSGKPGTFASSEEPVREDALTGANERFVFTGLSADSGASGFRTNVAFVSGTGGAAGELVLRAPSGAVLASRPFAFPPSTWSQRALADWLGGIAVPRDATLEAGVSSGTLTAYASVVDNGTGDPVLLAPAATPSGACPAVRPVLTASAGRILAGSSLTLRLDAPGRATGRIVPGDLPLGPGGSVAVSPSAATTYRWLPAAGCAGDTSPPVTVGVDPPAGTAMTEQGAVRGVAGGGAIVYRGIPFAAPPTGAMRWRPPGRAPLFDGVRDASAFGPVCPQLDGSGAVTGAEDCLSLNVYAPSAPPATLLPVLVFVHGGANIQGASSLPVYDGTVWASKGRAVVVTTNYRLATFGWLAQPFLSAESVRGVSGNYGTLDQLAALRWVQRNAAAFGGDPSRVTVFGESAGGVNTCTLVASPLARGLFARALVESGGCVQKPLAPFYSFGASIVTGAGCAAAADPASCLRALPFDQVLLAVPPAGSIVASTGQLWGPAVDGFVLPQSPDAMLAAGRQNPVPFAIGANADETGEAAPPISTEADYRALVTAQFGPAAPLVLAKYPASSYPTPRKAYVAVTTDARFVCPSRRYARAVAAGGSPKVFRYFFSYPANKVFGAIHASELPFVFGSLSAVPGYTPDATVLALSEAMNASWAQFASMGDPNGPGLTAWPAYDKAGDLTMVWNSPPVAVSGVRATACDFWDSFAAAP